MNSYATFTITTTATTDNDKAIYSGSPRGSRSLLVPLSNLSPPSFVFAVSPSRVPGLLIRAGANHRKFGSCSVRVAFKSYLIPSGC